MITTGMDSSLLSSESYVTDPSSLAKIDKSASQTSSSSSKFFKSFSSKGMAGVSPREINTSFN